MCLGGRTGLQAFVWLLLAFSAVSRGQRLTRELLQAGDVSTAGLDDTSADAAADDDTAIKIPSGGGGSSSGSGRRPFLALKDPVAAHSDDVERLYEQGASVAAIAYLLLGAAQPLAQVEGSSNTLLPYLTPNVLRFYVSNPRRCSTALAQQLYELSLSLYGTDTLKACHYTLYTALQSTFTWVADNVALRLQEVPGQPLAAALWPDTALYPPLEFTAAVLAALQDDTKLGGTGATLEAACGLDRADFAALVPNISAVLTELHADLVMLEAVSEQPHAARWTPTRGSSRGSGSGSSSGSGATVAAAATGTATKNQRRMAVASEDDSEPWDTAEQSEDMSHGSLLDEQQEQHKGHVEALQQRRRSALTLPSNLFYSLPPSGFVKIAPAAAPSVMLPIIFHVMLYKNTDSSIGPTNYDQALSYMQRLVAVANIMAVPTSFQFFIKEVRNSPTTYPYLLLPDRSSWLKAPSSDTCTGAYCFSNATFMSSIVADFPRSINIFIASDSSAGVPLGYSYVPGSDLDPYLGHVFISWDSVTYSGSNSLSYYNDGPNTLLHEAFHHLGLEHPFSGNKATSCTDDDYVIDTPAEMGPITSSSFLSTASAYCLELFWGQYGGDWEAAYTRWRTTLGIPEADMNAWADSCPTKAGYDELGNYMTYDTPVCFAALGHFTRAQVERAHYMTAEMNPLLYAWGQYYAQNAAPPPPMTSPPPEFSNNSCRATAKSQCLCKASWTLNGNTYSYCDRTGSTNTLSCEVADPITCADCSTSSSSSACVLACSGTPRTCKRPPAPGTSMPPPPPPRTPSPPPHPPPPPPRSVPTACKTATNGCECRSSWQFDGIFSSYCASPDGDPRLWCQVTSSCSTFNNSNPYSYCSKTLTTAQCGGPIFFSTILSTPPAPPLPPTPPPDMRPRPPPAPAPSSSVVTVAEVRGSFTTQANCSLISSNGIDLRSDITSLLKQTLQVPLSYINLTNLTCGSIIATYVITFPAGATPAQVTSVNTAANVLPSATNGSTFESRWGTVSASSAQVNVLDQTTFCAGAPVSTLCPTPPPSPPAPPSPPPSPPSPPSPPKPPSPPSPPASSKKKFSLVAIICIAAGGGVLLIVLLLLVVFLCTRKRKVVAPDSGGVRPGVAPYGAPNNGPLPPPPPPQSYGGGGYGGYGYNGGGGGAPPPPPLPAPYGNINPYGYQPPPPPPPQQQQYQPQYHQPQPQYQQLSPPQYQQQQQQQQPQYPPQPQYQPPPAPYPQTYGY